ncbi:MAG: DUF423 domain-containing protein [Halopseudomonas aestusnigri]
MNKFWIISAAFWGALSVAVGAYSAHGFGGDETRVLWAQTGSSYGFVHVLALMTLTALGHVGSGCARARFVACACFSLGLILFTGGLFVKALADVSLGGPYIPVGGSLYIVGWLSVAAYGFTFKTKEV